MPKGGKKKGKGSGGKKARDNETREEREARQQAESLQQDERETRQQELARIQLREREIRENRYAHLNGIKIHNQWRKIMRMAKVEELRRDIEILSQNHEREVDRKDAIVQMLDRDLEEAEEQYGMAVRAHMLVVDSLTDLQYERMKALEAEFAADLRALEEEFDVERTEIVNTQMRQKKDMQDMLSAMEQEFGDARNELRQEFEAQREEIKNRNSEEYNVLKIQLEGIIEELERHFEQAHKAYLESTEHRTQAFKQLTRNDAQAARVIEKRMRKLVKLQESLTHWRTKIATNSREWEERNKALRSEKEVMSRHYGHLKNNMDHFRDAQANRLKLLALSSNAAMEDFKNKLSIAENVLKLGELCRKYETEQEKVLPFYVSPQVEALQHEEREARAAAAAAYEEQNREEEEEEETAQAARDEESKGAATERGSKSERRVKVGLDARSRDGGADRPRFHSVGVDDEGKEVEEWDYLNRFFRRYNKAVLDNACVDREKARLEKENADLRSILKQYLDGVSLNEDVMNNPVNPLLVVNNRLQVTLAERSKARQQAMIMRGQVPATTTGAATGPALMVVNARGGGAGGTPSSAGWQ